MTYFKRAGTGRSKAKWHFVLHAPGDPIAPLCKTRTTFTPQRSNGIVAMRPTPHESRRCWFCLNQPAQRVKIPKPLAMQGDETIPAEASAWGTTLIFSTLAVAQ